MLYLDSPSGVGLSYSETEEDYVTNDTHTAHDSNIFLREFFRQYEAFAKHPFYISGQQSPLCMVSLHIDQTTIISFYEESRFHRRSEWQDRDNWERSN